MSASFIRRLLLFFVMLAGTVTGQGQTPSAPLKTGPDTLTYDSTRIYTVVDEPPQDAGGCMGCSLGKYIHMDPDDGCAGGRVFLSFVVERDGTTSDARVLRSTCPGMDASILSALRRMSRWTPGRLKGRTVRARVTVPIVLDPR